MALPPLTHHEILELVGPFTRAGRRVDLEASDRVTRRLRFKPVEHQGDLPLREDLELEHPWRGTYRLTRTLTPTSGPAATMVAEGPDASTLLSRVEAVTPAEQFRQGDGFTMAYSHRVDQNEHGKDAPALLTRAVAQVGHLTTTVAMPVVKGLAAEVALVDSTKDSIELPDDLLAVIGWDWAPLIETDEGWRTKVRLRGSGLKQTRSAQAKIEKTVAHLAQRLSEPPARFHERFMVARWWSAVRRSIPVLTCLAIIGLALALPAEKVRESNFPVMAFMNLPLLIIGLSFTLQEGSRIEVPGPPRRSKAPSWRRARSQPQPAPASAEG